jgi:hypothetical protein
MDSIMNKTVWLVEAGYWPEEYELVGVFSTEEKAKAAAIRWNETKDSDRDIAVIIEKELDPEI